MAISLTHPRFGYENKAAYWVVERIILAKDAQAATLHVGIYKDRKSYKAGADPIEGVTVSLSRREYRRHFEDFPQNTIGQNPWRAAYESLKRRDKFKGAADVFEPTQRGGTR